MTTERLPYEDADTTPTMVADCEAARVALDLPTRRSRAELTAARATEPAPSILFEDYPREVRKREITVSAAAARLAAGLHLHLD